MDTTTAWEAVVLPPDLPHGDAAGESGRAQAQLRDGRHATRRRVRARVTQ